MPPSLWQQVLVVGTGGFVGATARFLLSSALARRYPNDAYLGTLAVNVLGCLLIGGLATWFAGRAPTPWRPLLITGVLGSLTTFSTFGYESFELLREERYRAVATSVAANLVCGLLAVWLGMTLVRRVLM